MGRMVRSSRFKSIVYWIQSIFMEFYDLFIGIILGLTGGGGSILTVPILVYILNLNPIIDNIHYLLLEQHH